jgi:hypothetical protein
MRNARRETVAGGSGLSSFSAAHSTEPVDPRPPFEKAAAAAEEIGTGLSAHVPACVKSVTLVPVLVLAVARRLLAIMTPLVSAVSPSALSGRGETARRRLCGYLGAGCGSGVTMCGPSLLFSRSV